MTFDNFRDKLRWIRARGTAVFSLGMVAVFAFTIYQELDRDGRISHTARIDMRMTGNWIENESRNCSMDMAYNQDSRMYVAEDVRCPNDAEPTELHNVPVAFWGRLAREKVPIPYWSGSTWSGGTLWRCIRQSERFTCYAVN